MTYLFFKRVTDVVVSLAGLTLLSPLLILLAVLIRLESSGPALYRGVRAGQRGVPFNILKFRSMEIDADKRGGFSTAIDDPRLTRLGRSLRKYKLDELPQLINVLKGEMSLVGPRPQVLYYTNKYKGDELSILTVKPGITDLASLYFVDMDSVLGTGDVDSRYQLEVEPIKNQLRIRYVRECSYILDMRIIIETIFGIFGLKNITRLNLAPGKDAVA
jgi:lipopolysaccharide/colanic/teichoic acid biosynthesis glycosyltransferase